MPFLHDRRLQHHGGNKQFILGQPLDRLHHVGTTQGGEQRGIKHFRRDPFYKGQRKGLIVAFFFQHAPETQILIGSQTAIDV